MWSPISRPSASSLSPLGERVGVRGRGSGAPVETYKMIEQHQPISVALMTPSPFPLPQGAEGIRVTRRGFLIGAGAAVLLAPSARATPDEMRAAMRAALGDRVPTRGRLTLDIPPLVENGNTVPMTISVASPMTASDYVKTIHVFNEKNPQPYVVTAHLTPRNGKAQIATRIKLADSQKVIAVAEMSDGSLWSES